MRRYDCLSLKRIQRPREGACSANLVPLLYANDHLERQEKKLLSYLRVVAGMVSADMRTGKYDAKYDQVMLLPRKRCEEMCKEVRPREL